MVFIAMRVDSFPKGLKVDRGKRTLPHLGVGQLRKNQNRGREGAANKVGGNKPRAVWCSGS